MSVYYRGGVHKLRYKSGRWLLPHAPRPEKIGPGACWRGLGLYEMYRGAQTGRYFRISVLASGTGP